MKDILYYFNEITNFIFEIFSLFAGAWVVASIIVICLKAYIEKYCEKINVNLNKTIYIENNENKNTELPSFKQELNSNHTILEKYITKIQIIHAIIIWIFFIISYYELF